MKKVHFNENLNKVHTLVVWDYASRQARDNFYERLAWDRAHFHRRIHRLSVILNKILTLEHRNKIYCERFNV